MFFLFIRRIASKMEDCYSLQESTKTVEKAPHLPTPVSAPVRGKRGLTKNYYFDCDHRVALHLLSTRCIQCTVYWHQKILWEKGLLYKKKKIRSKSFLALILWRRFVSGKKNNKNKHHLQKVFDFLFLAFFSKLSKSKKTRLSLKIIQIWLIHSINQNYSRIVSTRGNTNIHVCSICMHILFSSRNFILKWNIYFQPKMTWKKITRWEKENFSE